MLGLHEVNTRSTKRGVPPDFAGRRDRMIVRYHLPL